MVLRVYICTLIIKPVFTKNAYVVECVGNPTQVLHATAEESNFGHLSIVPVRRRVAGPCWVSKLKMDAFYTTRNFSIPTPEKMCSCEFQAGFLRGRFLTVVYTALGGHKRNVSSLIRREWEVIAIVTLSCYAFYNALETPCLHDSQRKDARKSL